MGAIERMDNWTLIVCIALVTSMSSFALWRTWRAHRLRGSREFALAFLLGMVTCFLFALVPDSTPLLRFLNTVVGDTLALLVYALLLSGFEQFFGVRRLARLGFLLVAAALLFNFYFTFVQDNIADRMLVNTSGTLLFRVLIGLELLRHQGQGRRHLRTLGSLMLTFALVSFASILDTLFRAGPRNANEWLNGKSSQQLSLLLTLLFFIALGQLLFLLLNGELVLRLHNEASTDFMTGTLNRRGIERVLDTEVRRSQRYGMALSVGLIDLDHFKQINDTFGHAQGDHALRVIAEIIGNTLRAYDCVGRFGGDEFLVILPNTRLEEGRLVMERLRDKTASSPSSSVTLSIGLSSLAAEDDSRLLLARVDEALYSAKQEGRNCTRVLSPASQGELAEQAASAAEPEQDAYTTTAGPSSARLPKTRR